MRFFPFEFPLLFSPISPEKLPTSRSSVVAILPVGVTSSSRITGSLTSSLQDRFHYFVFGDHVSQDLAPVSNIVMHAIPSFPFWCSRTCPFWCSHTALFFSLPAVGADCLRTGFLTLAPPPLLELVSRRIVVVQVVEVLVPSSSSISPLVFQRRTPLGPLWYRA